MKSNNTTDTAKSAGGLTYQYEVLSSVINATSDLIFYKDYLNKDGVYLGCNDAFSEFVGKPVEEIVNHDDIELFGEELGAFFREKDRETLLQKSTKTNEKRVTYPDGKEVLLSTSKTPFYTQEGKVVGIVGISRDITEKKQAEDALMESQKYLQAIIENEPECVKVVDPRGRLIDMNPAGLSMLEADTLKEVQEKALTSYILPQWRTAFIALHKEVMGGKSGILEFEVVGLKGTRRWLETHAVPMRDSRGNVTSLLGITRDITERKASELRIRYMADFDALTGLPNRAKLEEQLNYMISLSKRKGWNFALMFLDIDHFKDINDSLGHNVGDLLLVEFSKRIQAILREQDILARLGGDEFILLLPDTQADSAQSVAQKLLEVIRTPFVINEHRLTVTASIGIAIYPMDGLDRETLARNSDAAMYRAKKEGRNGHCFFTEEMQKLSRRNLELSNAMHQALANKEISLVYQPQVSLKTGAIIGAEALLRWEHPQFGNVSPAEFIPIAENNGLIMSIGEWVLRSATQQLAQWVSQGMAPIIMAVNLSAIQFRHQNLPELTTQILQETDFPPECLELELTEGVTVHNPENAIAIMNDLHERGIRMSIDDFGTGYSSLAYLKKFKVYKLKIDQSFVRDITTDPEDKAIVGAIINMAKSLGLVTIAEGVESIEQLEYLREEGCDEMQGYYYSRPLSAEAFESLCQEQQSEQVNSLDQ